MNLTDEQFWNLTFAQFEALVERYTRSLELDDYRIGLICSMIANTAGAGLVKHKKSYKPQDFMPKRRDRTDMDWNKAKDQFRALDSILKGNKYGKK